MATYWNSDDADTMVLEPKGALKTEGALLERKVDVTLEGATVLTRRPRPRASWIDVASDC